MTCGEPLDAALEELFLKTLVPDELDLSLAVEREVGAQAQELQKQWQARLEQARYEAQRAERRYKAVEPENRVVARTLERQWEERLREWEEVERRYSEARRSRHVELSEQERRRIRELAKDLPAVWRASTTRVADKKAMLRLVVESIALTPVDVPKRTLRVQVQWQGGAVTRLEVPRPTAREKLRTPTAAVERIRTLAAQGLRDEDMAEQLNAEGMRTASGCRWTLLAVRWVRYHHDIVLVAPDAPRAWPPPERHPDGRYSLAGAAKRFGVTPTVVRGWVRRGWVPARREDFESRRAVYWLEINEDTAKRLQTLVASRRTASKRTRSGRPSGVHAS